MPAWFNRKRDVTPTIDSLSFDTSAWTYHGEQQPNPMRLWEKPDHDAVSLHFFAIAPDIPPVGSTAKLSAFYADGLRQSRATLVECNVIDLADCPSIRLIVKAPQNPSGMMYQGVLTTPFRDFSFVVKIQCPEVATTGVREAVLFEQRLNAGQTSNVSGSGPVFPGWNPDAPEHDQSFPTHPISRLRRLLEHVRRSAAVDATVRSLPRFPLPGDTLRTG